MRSVSEIGGPLAMAVVSLWLAACSKNDNDPPRETPNQAPISNAGADQQVFKGATVTLDGAGSTDADGNALAYRWTQSSGASVSLSSGTTSRPTFTAPAATGNLVFSLIVNDGRVDSVADTIQVSVSNRVPVANAGADATVEAGNLFTLDGLGSTDADQDTLSYTWTQLSGPTVTLTSVANGRARFSAPRQVAQLTFGLVANDGEVSSLQDVVAVNVVVAIENLAPVAYTWGNFSVPKRAPTALSGAGYDPDGVVVTYRWTQVDGPAVTLTDAGTPTATFTAPSVPAVLTFELVVSDGVRLSDPERVVVTVENYAPDLYVSSLTPDNPRTLDDLTVNVDFYDPDADPLTIVYSWRRNGTAEPSVTGAVYPASLTTRGDVIAVTVSASDGIETRAVDATTTIEDTPPTLSANAPTSVNYGDPVSFQVTASGDDDGDATGNFIVTVGPAGFDISSNGAVTWQARLPMFDDHVDIAWSIGLVDAPGATVGGTIRVNHAARQLPLMRSGGTVPQNREQLLVTDLDANGIDDILVSDGRMVGTMVRAGAGYEQNWAYPLSLVGEQNGIAAIAAGNVSGDANQEIFVAADAHIRALDGATRKLAHEYTIEGVAQCYSLRVADLDNDGSAELVCLATDNYYSSSGAAKLVVLDAATLSLENVINQTGLGTSMDVGNVDADAALEIITANGYVYDGATRMNEWAFGPQFGIMVETGDVDGNGVDEIVATFSNEVRVYSAVTRNLRWTIAASVYCCGPGEMRVAELGGDARREIIVGDSQWGNVSAYRYNTVSLMFEQVSTMNSQDHGVSALGVGNVDGDANVELIWGTGVSHSGQDILIVAEQNTPTSLVLDWSSATVGEFDGPFQGGALARTAVGTQRLMFLSATTNSAYGGPKLFALDAATGATTSSGAIGSGWSSTTGIDVADADGDGIDEIFLSSADGYTPFFTTYDFASDTREWTSPSGYTAAAGLAHADVTGDGNAEFIVMGQDGRVTIFNVSASNIVWQSSQLSGNSGVDVDVADLDGDGHREVIALSYETLYVFGRTSTAVPYTQRATVQVPSAGRLLAADADGDGQVEIYVITYQGYYGGTSELRVFNSNLQPLRSASLSVRALTLALEPSAGARKNLLISTGSSSYPYYASANEIWAISALTGAGVWRSPKVPGEFSRDSLHAIDLNSDGQYELSFGTSVGAFVTR